MSYILLVRSQKKESKVGPLWKKWSWTANEGSHKFRLSASKEQKTKRQVFREICKTILQKNSFTKIQTQEK